VEFGKTRIVVIGGSAGSLIPLQLVLTALPAGIGAAVFVVEHMPANSSSQLPEILSVDSLLPVHFATDRKSIAPGRIYVAPSDTHMVLERGRVRLQRSPKDPYNRPAINVLFRSAAAVYASSVVGILLSGLLSDGVAGLWDIKNAGGVAIVQDPAEAAFPDMPRNALESVVVDYCLPAAHIGRQIVQLAGVGKANQWTGSAGAPRILILEDDAAQAIDLEDQVRSLGYVVVASVSTGEDALLAAQELPDLALVDIRLAGKLDGIETARLLRERFNVGVIYTTAHDDDETIRRLKGTLPSGYLGKPIRSKDLHGAIEVALSASGITAGGPE
jgi:CheY-like chemotaxis protein